MPGIRPFTGRKLTVGQVRGVYTPPTGGGGGGGPAFRSVSSNTSSLGSLTCTVPTGTASGDVLVMQVWLTFDPKSGTYGSLASSGWTQRAISTSSSGDGWGYYVYTKTAGASETSYSWTGGSNWFAASMQVMSISGATALDVVGSPSNNTLTATGVTTTTATDLLVGLWANRNTVNNRPMTPPGTMTLRNTAALSNTYFINAIMATETLSASGATGTRTATSTGAIVGSFNMLLAVK